MNRAAHPLLNLCTTISLFLCVATIAAWIASSEGPWTVSINLNYTQPRLGYIWQTSAGWWQFVSGDHQPLGDSDWGWSISGDHALLDVSPYYSFFDWENGWWKFILLWLVLPACRLVPWESLRTAPRDGTWAWLVRGPPPGSISKWKEIKNGSIAHCGACYLAALVLCGIIIWSDTPPTQTDLLFAFGIFLLAPITIPAFLILESKDPGAASFFLIIMVLYILPVLLLYLVRTNRMVRHLGNSSFG